MAVRRQCNRYRAEPFGNDFNDVLKRGKAFHKDGAFMMVKYGETWTAMSLPIWGAIPENAKVYTKEGRFWKESSK